MVISATHSLASCRASADPVMAYVARREWLCANHPHCPNCKEERQIQLKDWIWEPIAEWRCRTCGQHFLNEPTQESTEII